MNAKSQSAEPFLGSFDQMINQEKSYRTYDRNPDIYGWSGGTDNELDDCDYEPSLGAFEGHDDQNISWTGKTFDFELDPAEASGIGDRDGLLEQVGTQSWQPGGMI